jgi:hypothetical protein
MIKFWRTTDKYGPLSNFAQFGFVLDGKYYQTSEHYYQSQKSLDPAIQEKIRTQKTPKLSKQLASTIQLRPDWEDIKYQIMFKALKAKFTQTASLKGLLLETGDEILVEDSPYDCIWGCGRDGTGQNLLGKCLTEVRNWLRESS